MNEFILIMTLLFSNGQGTITTVKFDTPQACVVAGQGWMNQMKEVLTNNPGLKMTPIVACTPSKVLPKVEEKTETL